MEGRHLLLVSGAATAIAATMAAAGVCTAPPRRGSDENAAARTAQQLRRLRLGELRAKARAAGLADEAVAAALDDDRDPKEALVALVALAGLGRGACDEEGSQLRQLGVGALQTRAAAQGVDAGPIEDALDAEDPKGALIALILGAGESASDAISSSSSLREELRGLRLKQLRQRAAVEGLGEDAIDDALDGDDPKAALIDLLADRVASRGPAQGVLSSLEGGGDACAEMLSGVLDHAMDVLEQLSMSSPRKARRSVRDVSDRVEAILESVDAEWCDGVSRCAYDELDRLSALVACVRGLSSSSGVSEASDAVGGMIGCLDRCGSVVVQSMGLLSAGSGGDVAESGAGVMLALESLRGLSEARLESVCADEAAVYGVVKKHLSSLDACVGAEVTSGCMALVTLGCRNGLELCGTAEMVELGGCLQRKWLEELSSAGDDYAAGAASCALWCLSSLECGTKMAPESRQVVETALMSTVPFRFARKTFTEQGVHDVFIDSMKAAILRHDDILLACSWCFVCNILGYAHPGAFIAAEESGMFSAVLTLYRLIEPSPLPGEWWASTCNVVDVRSFQLAVMWPFLGNAKRVPSALQSSWWSELLDRAIRNSKLNAAVGLSERSTMSVYPIHLSLLVVEFAAQDESKREMLLESGLMDALEYSILNDFTYGGMSCAAYASGAAVALVGRNEGGKVLRCEAVHAVLKRMLAFLDPSLYGGLYYGMSAKIAMGNFTRIPIMAISDVNKKNMLQFEPLIDMLLQCLIIDDDNHRKGQDGADALQEASAGVLHELSLYGPGAVALRSHPDVVSALHKLCEVGTKVSRESSAAALFELEEDKRPKRPTSTSDGATDSGLSQGKKLPPPHVMASYNWDHQDVILRVVASLQDRGYLVWVDTEQMKGATVDTMALAVEGSAVVLIGVSRAYKESSNCRMEAQYALQKKKALIPLMLTQGYEADGWLGLLLGTSMWYALYGETLTSESAFEDRMVRCLQATLVLQHTWTVRTQPRLRPRDGESCLLRCDPLASRLLQLRRLQC
eukprot:COSAG06_NODE_392_length_16344_cov_4.086981_12_plen_1028_part_00